MKTMMKKKVKQYSSWNQLTKLICFLTFLFCHSYGVINVNATLKRNFNDTTYNNLDSITVKSRLVQKNKINLPYSLVQKNAASIKFGNYRTTPEALMGSSGVFVQKTNHGGGSAIIRGLTGNQTLLMLDGVRLNNATFRYGPNQYLNNIDLYTIDQIEVSKGTGSVEYGSDAIGGVIHLHSYRPMYNQKKTWNSSTTLKYLGQDMEKTARATVQYSQKNFAIQSGITLRNFGDLVGGKNVGVQSPSGYDETGVNTIARIQLNKAGEITISSRFFIQKDVPIYHKVLLESFKVNKIAKQERNIQSIQWEKNLSSKYLSKIKVTQSFQYSNEERESNKLNNVIYKYEIDQVSSNGTSVDLYSNPTKNWQINSGIDYNADKIKSALIDKNLTTGVSVNKRGLYPNNSSYKSFSVFNLHKIDLKKWHIEAGLRYNRFGIQLTDTSIGQVNINPSALVGNAGISYKLNTTNLVYASLSSGYRAPNIDDMGTLGIVDFRYELPSNSLEPEKSLHYELGYKLNTKMVQFDLSGFYLNLKDIITRQKVTGSIINGYQVYSKQNSDASYIKGFETNLALQLNQQFKWSSNLTYTYGQNETKNEPMRRIPPFFGQQELAWKKNNTQILVQHLYAGKQDRLAQGDKDDNRIGKNGTPNWNVFNISLNQQFKNIFIQLGGINLLNEKYKTHGSGIYAMGRTYSVLVQWYFHQ
jgi:outer membrane receptor protein involved in Fe transport